MEMKKKIEKDLITPVGQIQDEVVAPELSHYDTGSQIVVLDSMKDLPGDWRDIDLTSFLPEGEAIERELISPEDDLASEVASSEDGDTGTSDDGSTATSGFA